VRRPKKAIPEKHTTMLVLTEGEDVLLEQRPANGIWGGLLSLPELELAGEDVSEPDLEQAAARFGTVLSCERLQAFTHTFTHFKLHVAPYRVRLQPRAHLAAEVNHVWYPAARLADAPLPAPVKKLLLAVFRAPDLLG
jgi:A/G-specific adenine glycosylase